MSVYKDKKYNTWRVVYRYVDWTGKMKQCQKRGFKNKRDAVKWEKETLDRLNGNTDMTFASFVERYTEDMKPRLKENTWHTKEHVIRTKFLPYFGKRKLSEIKSQDILRWQNELTTHTDENGKPFSPVYLRSVSSQLSCLFNRAVKYYGLPANPVKKAGHMGTKKSREMLFWCGLREGELLALTPSDFDFEKGTVSVSKTYTRLNRKDVITTPKTEKSNRTVQMPQNVCDKMRDYIQSLYKPEPDARIFPFTKYFLTSEMQRGSKAAGVKRIRIHDLRHSHISLLIDMGFPLTAIVARVGHETVNITCMYGHMLPSRQTEMAEKLDMFRTETKEESHDTKASYNNVY
ncbi:MAG: tyrosine-type recombinase/integrase [Christensenellales bacterium]